MTMSSISYDKIIASPMFCAITKMTAQKIKKDGYLTLGDFLKSLSSNDLTALAIMCEIAENDESALDDLVALSEMLSSAEGCPSENDKVACSNLAYFMTVIACESLNRRGLVDVDYSKMSFGDDMKDEKFVGLKGGLL